MDTRPTIIPKLDPQFRPAAIWNRSFQKLVTASAAPTEVEFALVRPDQTCTRFRTRVLPLTEEFTALNLRFMERTLKLLLWQRGAPTVWISGCAPLVPRLSALYSPAGDRHFDHQFFGESVYGRALEILPCDADELPAANEQALSLGGHLDGCRIGFDLGGSDRKCAAVHLPRVHAIGGSAAGIYVNNEVRAASLFRGISADDFQKRIRRLFIDLKRQWSDVPFDVVNDGEVTALAGSMSLKDGALLGISMGTSQAVGYCTPDGRITSWLNELRHVLILGRVTSGAGGDMIIANARKVVKAEFPKLDQALSITMRDEQMKRHGQAVAATLGALRSLPPGERPHRVLGCEVWRGLDWMMDQDKVALDVGGNDELLDVLAYVEGFIQRFAQDVRARFGKQLGG